MYKNILNLIYISIRVSGEFSSIFVKLHQFLLQEVSASLVRIIQDNIGRSDSFIGQYMHVFLYDNERRSGFFVRKYMHVFYIIMSSLLVLSEDNKCTIFITIYDVRFFHWTKHARFFIYLGSFIGQIHARFYIKIQVLSQDDTCTFFK